MSAPKPVPAYTEFHPRWYRRRVSTWWWLGRWPYSKFILRELTSVFVAAGVVLMLLEIRALRAGPRAYETLQAFLLRPYVIAFNLLALAFVLFHSITWFNLAPRAMAVRLGGKRVPDLLIAVPNYLVWAAVSAAVAYILLRS